MARRAWDEVRATGHPNLVPLVRGHLAETLYQSAENDPVLLDEASALAGATIDQTARTGQTRSAIIAHALAAAIGTRQGRRGEAIAHARAAVQLWEAAGDQPAMRTEEVLYRAACAYTAGEPTAADRDLARSLLEHARAAIERKATGLADPQLRARFLDLPLNRRITDTT